MFFHLFYPKKNELIKGLDVNNGKTIYKIRNKIGKIILQKKLKSYIIDFNPIIKNAK
jgi:hypothetical protein